MSPDYRHILKEELAERARRNPRYSLRSFARDLRMSASRLSEILNGRYGLSRSAADEIAQCLGYSDSERSRFCDLVESVHARSRAGREMARIRLNSQQIEARDPENHILRVDTFRLLSDWYHFAILELTHVRGFKNDSKWIGRALNISPALAADALERLKRFKLLKEENGKLKPTEDYTIVPGDTPSQAIKDFHRQILERATAALFTQPLEKRDFSAIVMAVRKDKLPEAKRAIKTFRRNFCEKITGTPERDSVYCLAIQFFNLLEEK